MIRFAVEGIMPERALLRLRRAKIELYAIKKPRKDRIVFSVKEKDENKVFSVYPDIRYKGETYSPYFAVKLGATGVGKVIKSLTNRVGVILGTLVFCATLLFADSFIFGVRFIGNVTYKKEAKQILEENGVKRFSKYFSEREDLICASLLSLERVEFCSIKKEGLWLTVEIRLAPYQNPMTQSGAFCSRHSGTIVDMAVLQGTPLKKIGESVEIGETLIGGYVELSDGEKKECPVIARVSVACVYEQSFAVETEEEAIAIAYLSAGLSGNERVKKKVEKTQDGFYVKLEYTMIESMNL